MATNEKTKSTAAAQLGRFWEGVGRRKTSTARVRIYIGSGKLFSINNRAHNEYFPLAEAQQRVVSPLEKTGSKQFDVTVIVKGGGVSSQADAVRHGLARALLLFDQNQRQLLRGLGYLTRDSRMRERKKPGLNRPPTAPPSSQP